MLDCGKIVPKTTKNDRCATKIWNSWTGSEVENGNSWILIEISKFLKIVPNWKLWMKIPKKNSMNENFISFFLFLYWEIKKIVVVRRWRFYCDCVGVFLVTPSMWVKEKFLWMKILDSRFSLQTLFVLGNSVFIFFGKIWFKKNVWFEKSRPKKFNSFSIFMVSSLFLYHSLFLSHVSQVEESVFFFRIWIDFRRCRMFSFPLLSMLHSENVVKWCNRGIRWTWIAFLMQFFGCLWVIEGNMEITLN